VRTIVDWVQSWVDRESSDVAGGELVEAGRDAVELGDSAFALADWAPARRCGGVDLANTTFRSELLPHQWRALEVLRAAETRAGRESDMPNVKGSDLGRVPLVSADFWTSDHLSERSRSVDAFFRKSARAAHSR
jgi:hypothetical protein